MARVRALAENDWDDWRALWAGYLSFYRAEVPDATTRATFDRLCAGRGRMRHNDVTVRGGTGC